MLFRLKMCEPEENINPVLDLKIMDCFLVNIVALDMEIPYKESLFQLDNLNFIM